MRMRGIILGLLFLLASLPIAPQEVVTARRRKTGGGGGPTHTFTFTSSSNTHCTGALSNTSIFCTLGVAPGLGTIVLIGINSSAATSTPSVHDSGSGCVAAQTTANGSSATNDLTAGTAWLYVYVPSSTCNVTWDATVTSSVALSMNVNVISYTPTSPLVAQDGGDVIGNGNGTAVNTPSVPSTTAGDLQVCFQSSENGGNSVNSPWTTTGAGSSDDELMEIILSSSSSQACNFTQTSGHWDTIGAAFK